MSSTGMLLSGCFASSAIDSSGEILDIDGLDISDLEDGKGTANWEHKSDDSPGSSALDTVGKIVFAKKILKESDCDNDQQLMYWKKLKEVPYLYGIVRLFDGAEHSGAKAIAAIVRDQVANKEPLLCRFSIEGSTLQKEGNVLKHCVARRVAITLKPANRTCDSTLIEDPNAPKGFEKNPEHQAKDVLSELTEKHEHPNYTKLGGSVELECSPLLEEHAIAKSLKNIIKAKVLLKAIAAGTTSAAPGALVGGAALQREDSSLHQANSVHLISGAKAALRDYGHRIATHNKKEFKDFMKHRLPEASDAFLDRFADLVEDYKVKNLSKKEKKSVPQASLPGMEETGNLTVGGVEVKPNEGVKGAKFDERKGLLHTPRGTFAVHIPGKLPHGVRPSQANLARSALEGEAFNNAISDPKLTAHHAIAMGHWMKAHKLMQEGKTPPEMVMHASIFSMLSPNTPVPVQELMFSRLVDQMKQTGTDPTVPGAMRHELIPAPPGVINDRGQAVTRIRKPGSGGPLGEAWLASDDPHELPEHAKEYFEKLGDTIRLKGDAQPRPIGSGRKAGDISSFMLANDKLKNMSQYHRLHEGLVELVQRHKGDARSAVAELMSQKKQSNLWNAQRQRKVKAGQPDPGDFPGLDVPGLAPKTARYMWGMLGGGNVQVPDTHFVRGLFGLHPRKDIESIKHLKDVMWADTPGLLEGIDRYYAKNHPAVRHLLEQPGYRGAFAKDEDAIFPAFWKHWIAIPPYERARLGINQGMAANEGTSHLPYWLAVEPFMKHGIDYSLPYQTAVQHRKWADEYGDMPALFLYYERLLPRLMKASEEREGRSRVAKMEALSIEVRQLGSDLKKKEADEDSPIVDADKHGMYLHHPEQKALIHGVNVQSSAERPKQAGIYGSGVHSGFSKWVTSGKGTPSYLKGTYDSGLPGNSARKEAIYHNLAHSVFGLGQYVPTTAVLKHPTQINEEYSLQEGVKDAEHMRLNFSDGSIEDPGHKEILKRLGDSGELHKLFVMNAIMGQRDRHTGNFVFSKTQAPHLHLIDNGFSFQYPDSVDYLDAYHNAEHGHATGHSFPPSTAAYVAGLDPEHFQREMERHEMPSNDIRNAMLRMQAAKELFSNATDGLPQSRFLKILRDVSER